VKRDLPVGCYLCDYHIHSSHSFDAKGSMDEICQIAIQRGIHEIGFCEHIGIEPSDDAYGTLDYNRYRKAVEEARQRYSGRLKVKMGAEIDFRSSITTEIGRYLKAREFDFVVGGLHYIKGEIVMRTDIFERRSPREVWGDYFAELLAMVKTGLFDIIAHLDVPKRGYVPLHGRFDWKQHKARIRPVLAEIIKRETALEINTAGLRKQADELFPSLGILKLYRELGGKYITFGSDAHSPPRVGCDFARAVEAAEAAGFTHVATFSRRRKTLVPIRFQPGIDTVRAPG
jgi:histidinol-phosphatase (PHP family)